MTVLEVTACSIEELGESVDLSRQFLLTADVRLLQTTKSEREKKGGERQYKRSKKSIERERDGAQKGHQ